MSIPTPALSPSALPPKFDQVVEGNVDIKKLSKNNYRITVSDIKKFLLYQVWSPSSKTLNDERSVFYENANKWVKNFNSLNASLKASNKPLFTPTTVMEIGNDIYVFVIHKAKINRKGHVVFKVSTKEIKSSNKKMLKLPHGRHDRVRFDIDYTTPDLCSNIQYLTGSGNLSDYMTYSIVEFPLGNGWSSFKKSSDNNTAAPFLQNPLDSYSFGIHFPDTFSFLNCGANPPNPQRWLNTNNLEDLRTLPGDNLFLYNYVTTYLQLFPTMQNIY